MADYSVSYRYDGMLLRNEAIERQEEGADPSGLEVVLADLGAIGDHLSREQFDALYARLDAVPVRDDWQFDEPSDLAAIKQTRPENRQTLHHSGNSHLLDRVHGAWLGRACGCLLGKPVEGWTRDRVASYLHAMDAYPLDDYFPPPAPDIPDPGWMHGARDSLRGRIDGMPRDDDMDYPILNLRIVEKHGLAFTPGDIAAAWLEYLPYAGIYTAERLAYRNLVDEVDPPGSASRHNPYREWIGAQIRADLWGYLCPGDPERAAELARRDASVSHVKNGIYGEMFVAAAVAAALAVSSLDDVLDAGLEMIPARSRFARMVRKIRERARGGSDWEADLDVIQQEYGHYHWIHTVNNAAVLVTALCHSEGDFSSAITKAVMGGWDTDCNGATAGSILGALGGVGSIPPVWADPLHDTVRSVVMGEGRNRISDLVHRTMHQIELARTRNSRSGFE